MYRLIDFWHVLEKLTAATHVLVAKDETATVLTRWKSALRNRSTARADILRELVASGKDDVRIGDSRPVHEAITYLTNNASRMDYATALRARRPIGSGNVEATCKSLVGVRMKRPGARWKNDTGEHVVHLRALGLSDRWSDAMDITLRPVQPRMWVAA